MFSIGKAIKIVVETCFSVTDLETQSFGDEVKWKSKGPQHKVANCDCIAIHFRSRTLNGKLINCLKTEHDIYYVFNQPPCRCLDQKQSLHNVEVVTFHEADV